MRALRVSGLAWLGAGGVAMLGMTVAIGRELRTFAGGPQALAQSILPSAEALRAMRWPAERLDTLGGYITYHNVILVNLLLALYGAVQGARAIRGGEERHVVEELLATGLSRVALLRERALGFGVVMAGLSLGLGLGTAAGLGLSGAPDLVGSLITLGTAGLVGLVGYGLGSLVAQVTASARLASGVSCGLLAGLYVITNLGATLGPLAGLRFISPFHWANFSRALVPGQGLDGPATAVLGSMALGLLALAGWAFTRRDYAAPLWTLRAKGSAARAVQVPTVMLSSLWTATLRRSWVGLLAWTLGAGGLCALMGWLQPNVMKVWSSFDFLDALTGSGPGGGAEAAYWSLSGELVSPVLTAYVMTRASGWVAELEQGRVEVLLSGPRSWTRLVVERLFALGAGVVAITAGGLGGLALSAAAVGGALDLAGLGRLGVVAVLFGLALGAVAALAVAWLRRGLAVTLLGVTLAADYLLAWCVPLLGWPPWLTRLSIFWAFGHPYLEWPPTSALVVLLALAVPGAWLAAALAERTPKVA